MITNVELDHHATYANLGELEEAFEEFAAPAAVRVLGPGVELGGEGEAVEFGIEDAEHLTLTAGGSQFVVDGVEVNLQVPGEHNVLNALAALAALGAAGVPPADAAPGLAKFTGAGRRFEPHGHTAAGARIYDDYAHHPTEVRATLAAARTLEPRRLVAAFQPHLYSRTQMLARDFGRALALADLVVVLDVYRARERPEDFPDVSGFLIAQSAADAGAGTPGLVAAGHRRRRSAAPSRAHRRRPAAHARRRGRGRAGAEAGRVSTPAGVEADYPLARLTTIRTGGHGDFFARPDSPDALAALLAWATGEGVKVGVVGSGSNLLVADEGFRGLVVKLDGSLATIEQDGQRLRCGGGARLPQAAAFAARAGLSGLEFGVNIPGTVGGAVKMNANAYGGDLARVLEWVEVTTPTGTERRAPDELGFSYRRSNLAESEIVARASFALSSAEPETVKATLADMRASRKAAQPSGIKTFGSTFKNPDDPRAEGRSAGVLLDEAGCRGLTVGGARFSEKHANFVENMGEATTADVIALMGEGRRRVRERFGVELEPEVQFLGEVDTAPLWGSE